MKNQQSWQDEALTLRQLLWARMQERGLNQVRAASVLGVGAALLNKWLHDDPPRPSYENCGRIARFLDRPVEDVLTVAGYEVGQNKPTRGRPRLPDPRLAVIRSRLTTVQQELDALLRILPRETADSSPQDTADNPAATDRIKRNRGRIRRLPAKSAQPIVLPFREIICSRSQREYYRVLRRLESAGHP